MALAECCWIWNGRRAHNGYGQTDMRGRTEPAHRVIYEMMVGPIPTGMQLDHLCRNRPCVNPRHLRIVTLGQNVMAEGSRSPQKQNSLKMNCFRGHEYTATNTERNTSRHGRRARRCRECRRLIRRAKLERAGLNLLIWEVGRPGQG